MATKKSKGESNAAAVEPKPKFVLPEGFEFPEMPTELREGLEDVIRDVIYEWLPPEWSEVITDYTIMYGMRPGDSGNTLADYAGWVNNFHKLQLYLAGARCDESGNWSEWVGPAPKLGKKAVE